MTFGVNGRSFVILLSELSSLGVEVKEAESQQTPWPWGLYWSSFASVVVSVRKSTVCLAGAPLWTGGRPWNLTARLLRDCRTNGTEMMWFPIQSHFDGKHIIGLQKRRPALHLQVLSIGDLRWCQHGMLSFIYNNEIRPMLHVMTAPVSTVRLCGLERSIAWICRLHFRTKPRNQKGSFYCKGTR